MKVSREQMAENRVHILKAAGRLFREKGYDAVTVSDVMKAANLTHGGFYGHFKSKDDLYAQALSDTIDRVPLPGPDLEGYAQWYLSEKHRRDLANGCPAAALAAETVRQSPKARAEMTEGLRRQIERLTPLMAGVTDADRRRAAIAAWASMVGAVILARVSDNEAFSKEILDTTRASVSSKAR